MATKKKSAASTGGKMIVTEDAIVISLSAAEKRAALRCIEKNGKLTFSVSEHSATKLPAILDNGKSID